MKRLGKSDGNIPPKFGAEAYLKEQEELKKEMYLKLNFFCKHCGSGWETKVSCRVHESWCQKNPNRRRYESRPESVRRKEKPIIDEVEKEPVIEEVEIRKEECKIYTIEEIRELDNTISLTDEQIAKLVRGKKDEN